MQGKNQISILGALRAVNPYTMATWLEPERYHIERRNQSRGERLERKRKGEAGERRLLLPQNTEDMFHESIWLTLTRIEKNTWELFHFGEALIPKWTLQCKADGGNFTSRQLHAQIKFSAWVYSSWQHFATLAYFRGISLIFLDLKQLLSVFFKRTSTE